MWPVRTLKVLTIEFISVLIIIRCRCGPRVRGRGREGGGREEEREGGRERGGGREEVVREGDNRLQLQHNTQSCITNHVKYIAVPL